MLRHNSSGRIPDTYGISIGVSKKPVGALTAISSNLYYLMRNSYRWIDLQRRGNTMKTIGFFAVLLLLLAAITSSPIANPVLAYVFEDTGASGWGQAGVGNPPYWEWMTLSPDMVSAAGPQDLDPANAFYVSTEAMTGDWGAHQFGAVICFANRNENSQNTVLVELRKGSWLNEGILLYADSAIVDNVEPARYYSFNLGVHPVPSLSFNNESLIIKIKYFGPAGDTRIYWDTSEHWSHMYAGTVSPVESTTWGRIKALYEL
jgi:hypothetical protein